MRELKFRIWDKKNKIFIYEWDASHKRLAISLVGLVYHGGYDDVLPENDYVVQQWTGLKDSKGIEIYEGDIVEFKTPFHGNLVTDSVAFDNGSFILEDMLYNLSDTKVRVIGSIFEPPNY